MSSRSVRRRSRRNTSRRSKPLSSRSTRSRSKSSRSRSTRSRSKSSRSRSSRNQSRSNRRTRNKGSRKYSKSRSQSKNTSRATRRNDHSRSPVKSRRSPVKSRGHTKARVTGAKKDRVKEKKAVGNVMNIWDWLSEVRNSGIRKNAMTLGEFRRLGNKTVDVVMLHRNVGDEIDNLIDQGELEEGEVYSPSVVFGKILSTNEKYQGRMPVKAIDAAKGVAYLGFWELGDKYQGNNIDILTTKNNKYGVKTTDFGLYYPLRDSVLDASNEWKGWPKGLRIKVEDLPDSTIIGSRGAMIPWSRLENLPNILITKDIE